MLLPLPAPVERQIIAIDECVIRHIEALAVFHKLTVRHGAGRPIQMELLLILMFGFSLKQCSGELLDFIDVRTQLNLPMQIE